jgi:hypothetical protein
LELSVTADQKWYLDAVWEYSDLYEENPASFEINFRFIATDATNGKEEFDEFTLKIEGTGESKAYLCYDTLDSALTITDKMAGTREYQITDDMLTDGWQSYTDEGVLAGFETLTDCHQQLTMTLDYKKYSGSWVTLWSEYGHISDLSHTIMPYVEVTDTGFNKIWVHVTQQEFEEYLQVEYKTSANEISIEMRVAYKTLSGEVFDNLTGTFIIKFYGIVKEDDAEPHECADVSLTKKNTVANEKMAFAKEWDQSEGDQYWSKTVQGVLDVKQSDETKECDTVYEVQVYNEITSTYVDWVELEDILTFETGRESSSSIFVDDWGSLEIDFNENDIKNLTSYFTDTNGKVAVKI